VIFGVGIDLVETQRMRDSLERHGERFAGRILAESEWEDFRKARDGAVFLAKAFAAKEALGKACGTGIRNPVNLRSMWLLRDDLGKPSLAFAPDLGAWLSERRIVRHHLSLTDERAHVAAIVVLETPDLLTETPLR